MFNKNLETIREQIASPNEQILTLGDAILPDLSDEMLGINIVTEPEELQSFLAVFDLAGPQGTKNRYSVFLPGPESVGIEIYDRLKQWSGRSITVNLEIIPDDFDFNEFPWLALDIWEEV